MLSLSAWISSTIASECLKNDWPRWSKENPLFAGAMEALPAEVSALARDDLHGFLTGVAAYTHAADAQSPMTEPPVIWRQGAARLLDYGALTRKTDVTLLFVPSLINRYHVLDLLPDRSVVRWLARKGVAPMVLDWGTPGDAESAWDSADYVTKVLLPAIRFVHETSGQKVALAGYCMGGVLALAAAQLLPEAVSALALFATPWDFHAGDVRAPRLDDALTNQLEGLIGHLKMLPAAQLQMLFYWNDPWLFSRKFRQFGRLKPGTRAFNEFMALEHWVNDGVPLAHGVARDCLIEWGQRNTLMQGKWSVAGTVIDPKKIRLPAFAAAPQQDRIVPPGCAAPLAKLLKKCTFVQPTGGHVGMMVGSHATKECWEPFVQWLRASCL